VNCSSGRHQAQSHGGLSNSCDVAVGTWKDSSIHEGMYRLGNPPEKVVEKIVAGMISNRCEHWVLHPGQFGSRKGRPAVDAVGILINRMQAAWQQGKVAGRSHRTFSSSLGILVSERLKRLQSRSARRVWARPRIGPFFPCIFLCYFRIYCSLERARWFLGEDE